MSEYGKPYPIRLEKDVIRQLDYIAALHHSNRSEQIRIAIIEYLEKHLITEGNAMLSPENEEVLA